MDKFFKILIGDVATDNESAAPAPVAATGDDKSAIAEAVLAGASAGQLTQTAPQHSPTQPVDMPQPAQTQPSDASQPAPTAHTDIAAQTEITPQENHAQEVSAVASQEPEQKTEETKEEKPAEEVAKPQEEVIAKVEEAKQDVSGQQENIDYATTDAAEDLIGRLGRKLQMKVIFTQAVASEFGISGQPSGNNAPAFGGVAAPGASPAAITKTAPQTQDALADKLAALRNQLNAEVKPEVASTPQPGQTPSVV